MRSFYAGRIFPVRSKGWLPAFVLLVGLATLAGCGSESSTRPIVGAPEISGALVPETAEEGTELSIEVWGSSTNPDWVLDHFDVRGDASNVLTITPAGHIEAGAGTGGAFHGTATFAAPSAGSHTVRVGSGRGQMEFPLQIFPRHPILHLFVRGGPDALHEELVVGAEGWAIAFRAGAPAIRAQISAEEVAAIRQSFQSAGFFELEDRYLGNEPSGDLFYQIFYRDAGVSKQIRAEDRLAPEPLRALVSDLKGLIERLVQAGIPAHRLVGRIEVDPLVAEAGAPRSIRLSIENQGAEPETLRFASSQTYDVAVMGPMNMHDGDGMGDLGGAAGGSRGGMQQGGPGGGGCGSAGNGQAGNLQVDANPPGPHRLVWNWAFGRSFTQNPTDIVLAPAETIEYEVVWPGAANDGSEPADGRYLVQGIVPANRHVPVRGVEIVLGNAPPPALRLTLRLAVEPREAGVGSSREIRFSILNPTEAPITLTFPTSQIYDFLIYDPQSMHAEPLWSWSTGRAFERVETPVTIPGNDRIDFVETWNGTDDDANPVGPGSYRVGARLTLSTGQAIPVAEWVRIVVDP